MLAQPSSQGLDLEVNSPTEAEEAMVAKVASTVAMGRTHVHLTTQGANNRDMASKETTIAVLLKVVEVKTPTLCLLVIWEMLMSARQRKFSDLWESPHCASE